MDNDHFPVLVCRPGGSRPVVESGRGGLKSEFDTRGGYNEERADEQPEEGLDCCPVGMGWFGINVWVSVQAPLGHLNVSVCAA